MKEKLHWPQSLLELMRSRDINPFALSKKVEISHVTIGNYLSGQLPKSEHLLTLAEFFGVTTDAMLGRPMKYPDHQPQVMVIHDGPRKKEIARLTKIADTLGEQIGELRRAITELEK